MPASTLDLCKVATKEQDLKALNLVAHTGDPHTCLLSLRLRDDYRHLWIVVARALAC